MKSDKEMLVCIWVGEFGWEVVWQGMCRKQAEGYDNVIACSFPGSQGLYADFCTRFEPHEFSGFHDSTRMPSAHHKVLLDYMNEKWPGAHYLIPMDGMEQSMLRARSNNVGKYIVQPSVASDIAFDIVIHARHRTDQTSKRNWSIENWNRLVSRLRSDGLTVAAMGTTALCPQGAIDIRGKRLEETAGYIKASKLMVGPSSGPMVFGMLCNQSIVTWGERRAHDRFAREWNFHNSPNVFCHRYQFNPPVDHVHKLITQEIRRKR